VPIKFIDFALDPATGCLHGPEGEIRLRPKTLALLEVLVAEAPKVLTKNELMDRVWGKEHLGETSLAQAVSELRRALQDNSRQPRIIETLHRRGYRFIAPLDTTPGVARSDAPLVPEPRRLPVVAYDTLMSVPRPPIELERFAVAQPRWRARAFLACLVLLGILALLIGVPNVQSQPVQPLKQLVGGQPVARAAEQLDASRLEPVAVLVVSLQDEGDSNLRLQVEEAILPGPGLEGEPRIYVVPLPRAGDDLGSEEPAPRPGEKEAEQAVAKPPAGQ